jgi:carbon-monoxide dehydrogenase medium subunit
VYDFKYVKANSIKEAEYILSHEPDSILLAGGMTLLPVMKQRLLAPKMLIDISSINRLIEIDQSEDFIEIGSMCTHFTVASSKNVRHHLPALAFLANNIADAHVRYKGTIGGSLANNDPSADYPAALVGMGGVIVTNLREIKAEDFFLGMFTTALEKNEIIVKLRFSLGISSSYQKFKHPSSGYAFCGVWISKLAIDEYRVAITGVYPCVQRWKEVEKNLRSNQNQEIFMSSKIDRADIFTTHDSTILYKEQLMRILGQKAFMEIM